MKARALAGAAAPHVLVTLACGVTLLPLLWVVAMSLSPSQGFSMSAPGAGGLSFENYVEVLTSRDLAGRRLFLRQLINSLIVSACTTVMGVTLACSAAYAFSRFRFLGKRSGMTALLVTQMFPGVVMAIPLYLILDALHLVDNLAGLVLVYSATSLPFSVWMLKGYFDTIPVDIEEAALVDGASRWTVFMRIVLPLARPAIAITALFSFMTAWNEFILAATFMGSELHFTLPVALQSYVGEHDARWGCFAAGAVLVSIPVVLLFIVLQRQLVAGLTAGGVKG